MIYEQCIEVLSVFYCLMAPSCHGTVCTAATAGGLTLFLIFYHTHYDKDENDKKYASAEDSTQILIKERYHKVTLSLLSQA